MLVSQIHLFTGENAYLLSRERRNWIQEFCKRHGDQNLLRLEGAGITFRELLDEGSTAPFLGEKRLIVIDGIPRWSKEEVALLPLQLHEATVLLFVDPKPDKRLAGTKELLTIATVNNLTPLPPRQLRQWTTQEVQSQGCRISDAAVQRLLDLIGNDQQSLSQEISKLTLYARSRAITEEDIERLVVPSAEQEVWHLTGLIARGKSAEALQYAKHLSVHGEGPAGVWNILLWMLRCLVSVVGAVQEGARNPGAIASVTKVPFPTVSALLPLAKAIDLESLKRFIEAMSRREVDLKTGALRMSGDSIEEVASAVDAFIVGFPAQ